MDELKSTDPPVVQADAPAPAQAEKPDAAAASPLPAEGAGSAPSLIDQLTKRLNEQRQVEVKEAPEVKAEAKPDAKPEEDETPGETPEEKQAFKGKPAGEQIKDLRGRLRQTTRELNETKARIADYEAVQGKARNFDEFSGWVKSTGLSQDEVAQGLQISALMKTDPFKALEVVTPIYQELQRRAGAVLPQDLAEAVETGEVSEARAKELARLRQEREHLAHRSESQSSELREREDAYRVQQLQVAVREAVNEAERQVAAGDIDYPKKKEWVAEQVKALWVTEGVPNGPDAAVAQYRKAVKMVNDRVALMTPKRPEARPVIGSTGGAPEPKSALEATRLMLEKAGRQVVG